MTGVHFKIKCLQCHHVSKGQVIAGMRSSTNYSQPPKSGGTVAIFILAAVALAACQPRDSATTLNTPQGHSATEARVVDNPDGTEVASESERTAPRPLRLGDFPTGWTEGLSTEWYFWPHCDWGGALYADYPPASTASFSLTLPDGELNLVQHLAIGEDAARLAEVWLRRLNSCDGRVNEFANLSARNSALRPNNQTSVQSISVGTEFPDSDGFQISGSFVQKPLNEPERIATRRILAVVSRLSPNAYSLTEVAQNSPANRFGNLVPALEFALSHVYSEE